MVEKDKVGLFREIGGSGEVLVRGDKGFEKATFSSPEVESVAVEAADVAVSGAVMPVERVRRRRGGGGSSPPSPPPSTPSVPVGQVVPKVVLEKGAIIDPTTKDLVVSSIPRLQQTTPRKTDFSSDLRRLEAQTFTPRLTTESVDLGGVGVKAEKAVQIFQASQREQTRNPTFGGAVEATGKGLVAGGLGALKGAKNVGEFIVENPVESAVIAAAFLTPLPEEVPLIGVVAATRGAATIGLGGAFVVESGERIRESPTPFLTGAEIIGEAATIAGVSALGEIAVARVGGEVSAAREARFLEKLDELDAAVRGSPVVFDRFALMDVPPSQARFVREPIASELAILPPSQARFVREPRFETIKVESGPIIKRVVPNREQVIAIRAKLLEEKASIARSVKPEELQTSFVSKSDPDVVVEIPSANFKFGGSSRGLFVGRKGSAPISSLDVLRVVPKPEVKRVDSVVERVVPEVKFPPLKITSGLVFAVPKPVLPEVVVPKPEVKSDDPVSVVDVVPVSKRVFDPVNVGDVVPVSKRVVEGKVDVMTRSRVKRKVIAEIFPPKVLPEIAPPKLVTKLVTELAPPKPVTELAPPKLVTELAPPAPGIVFPRLRPDRERVDSSSLKVKTVPEGFEVFVRRFGRERLVASGLGRKAALGFGAERVRKTLAATFSIRPTGRPARFTGFVGRLPSTDEFRTFKKSGGRRIPLVDTFIQKRGKRLGSSGEIDEIKFFKSKSLRGGLF